jgi:hypothetical protein
MGPVNGFLSITLLTFQSKRKILLGYVKPGRSNFREISNIVFSGGCPAVATLGKTG